jgi:hypothetical protein
VIRLENLVAHASKSTVRERKPAHLTTSTAFAAGGVQHSTLRLTTCDTGHSRDGAPSIWTHATECRRAFAASCHAANGSNRLAGRALLRPLK